MKINSKLEYILTFGLGLSACMAFGHDVAVHQAITKNAAASAKLNSSAYFNFLTTVASDNFLEKDAANYMVEGSAREDDPVSPNPPIDGAGGGYRSLNHFYDPLDISYGKGLSDSIGISFSFSPPPSADLSLIGDNRALQGDNSFLWGSISNCVGLAKYGLHPINIWSWQNARNYEWNGLTATSRDERFSAMTNMFRAVGQVMHLLEDTSQPQHVRNEQHLDQYPHTSRSTPWRSPIEDYGNDNVANLNYGDGSMLDWRDAGFTKLEDFWDRHLYNGSSAAALVGAENGGAQLGLAEWCNGNFLGDRHTYTEYFSPGDIRKYPYPSLFTSTPYLQHGAYIENVELKNGEHKPRRYLSKTGDGININHFSVISYFGERFPNKIILGTSSIRDDHVLNDYHNAFIPKAVKYSAGLLDYYFRGTMSANVIGYDTNLMQCTNLIMNTCGQDFSGGTFSVFQDDPATGKRTLLGQTALSATLPNNSSLTMTFTDPTPPSTNLMVVYQGTIGINGTQPLDPVDANIGIAVAKILPYVEETTMTNYDVPLDSIGLNPGDTMTGFLESDEFPFPINNTNYQVMVNFAQFDDKGMIGSIQSTGPSESCDWGNEITNTLVSFGDVSVDPDDNRRLRVAISATDNGVCNQNIGWYNINITWRATPPSQ